jgi:ankyrin repeat protein
MEEQLRVAAGHNDVVMIRRLVVEGTDVNDQAANGGRPLHLAAMYGHVDAVQACTSAGGGWG